MKTRVFILCVLCFGMLLVPACMQQPVERNSTPLDISRLYIEPTAKPAPTPTEPSGRTVIEFWTDDHEPERVAVYRDVAFRFMRQNPNVELRIVPVNESSLSARLATAIQADALPDIIRLGAERVASLAADDLLDVTATQAVIESVGEDDFRAVTLQMVIDAGTGQYMAVPYDGWIQALWYRADLFEEHKLPPPSDWETIRTAASTLQRTSGLEYGLVLPTDPGQNYVHQVFEQIAISNGVWPFDEAGSVTMNTPEMVEALTWYAQLQEFALPGPQHVRSAREAYQQGRVGMIFYSTYLIDHLVRGADRGVGSARSGVQDLAGNTDFAPVVDGPNGSATYGQLVTLAILRQADPAARDVVEFFLTEGYIDVLALAPYGKVPVLKSAVDAWKDSFADSSIYSDETLDQITNGYDSIQRWLSHPDYDARQRAVIGEIEGQLLIPQVIYEIAIENTLTPQAAAERLQTEVEALLTAR